MHTGVPENSIVLLEEKSTVPLGLVAVPVSVSETTASQVPVWPRRITDAQVTEVEVARSVACEEFAEAVPSHNLQPHRPRPPQQPAPHFATSPAS